MHCERLIAYAPHDIHLSLSVPTSTDWGVWDSFSKAASDAQKPEAQPHKGGLILEERWQGPDHRGEAGVTRLG